jgi:hypothetical protein
MKHPVYPDSIPKHNFIRLLIHRQSSIVLFADLFLYNCPSMLFLVTACISIARLVYFYTSNLAIRYFQPRYINNMDENNHGGREPGQYLANPG